MMKRTTIMLPISLKRKVELRARQENKSLGSFIRESLEQSLKQNGGRTVDPLFACNEVFEDDGPPDLAERHDFYLLKMLQHKHFHNSRRSKRRKSG